MNKPRLGTSRARVLGAVIGLSILSVVGLTRLACSPAHRAPADASGAASRALRPLDPREPGGGDGPRGTHATVDRAGHDDAVASPSPVAAEGTGLGADVRPDPPPEAYSAAQPQARSPDRDTGLVFRSEPPGDHMTAETKDAISPLAQPARSGPIGPAVAAEVHLPPGPEAWLPAPPRIGPDRDTGLVFSDQPGADGASDDKR